MARALAVSARVELVSDRGATAEEEEEFFRGRPFLGAEGTTHSLVVEDGATRIAIPLIVRDIPGSDRVDAISPYGYPGAAVLGAGVEIEPEEVDWSGTGLVSVFVRDRVGGPACLAGATERSLVQVSDPGLKRKSRMSDRQQIRRNEADGYGVEVVPGPDAGAELAAELHRVYDETMVRGGAGPRFRFDREYFEALLRSPRASLFLARGPDSDVAAAAIVVESDGLVHYYLSGTADVHREASPSKNLIVAVTEHAEERDMPMNLGGGLRPGDALEAFKRGFANRELPFRTHEIVCDRDAYSALGSEREDTGFFPRYRAPAAE